MSIYDNFSYFVTKIENIDGDYSQFKTIFIKFIIFLLSVNSYEIEHKQNLIYINSGV